MRAPKSTGSGEPELAQAWRALLQRQPQLRSDRRLAELALELVSALGNTRAHRETLRLLADAWGAEWRLALPTASLLIAQAERAGMDEPVVSEDTPAHWAAATLQRSLDALDGEQRGDPDIAGNLNASLGNALRRCGPRRDGEAQAAFARALDLDAHRGSWWYDLGLLHKWRGRFDKGLDANQRAADHGAPRRPTLWNLAICATARGEGAIATQAWASLGMLAETDPTTTMPCIDGLPPRVVRVLSRPSEVDATSDFSKGVGFELVWVASLSPCHGVVQSPTFRDAPIDFGDLVLWDGAPVAEHARVPGETVPVFPLLEILKRGDERRWPFVALEREAGALEQVQGALPEGVRVFVQHERIEHHCAACEAGTPHEHAIGSLDASAPALSPDTDPQTRESTFLRGKIIVPADVDLTRFRAAWEDTLVASRLVAALPLLYESLHDTRRAGQEHQAWRGIEKRALLQKAHA